MATLEQILEEVRKLSTEEQRRLRDALDELSSNGAQNLPTKLS
jgi:hypothetical protein